MTTYAILDRGREFILVVGEAPDDASDAKLARLLGWPDTQLDYRRLVWLPMGGEVNDAVEVDDDGVARVV